MASSISPSLIIIPSPLKISPAISRQYVFYHSKKLHRNTQIAARGQTEETEPSESTSPSAPLKEATEDFWEGEKWEAFGTAATFALPVLVAIAVGVGLFAAQTYNNDATVFLESPKSDSDSAKLITFE